jgi:penicillin-binding protein 1A
MKKFIKVILVLMLLSILLVSGGIYFLYEKYSKNLPDYDQLQSYTPLITTRLYAADGTLINEFSKEKRVFVPIANTPKHLINAFLAAEDANFYAHYGIDPIAILRTSIQNAIALLKGDPIVGGASTITQQVVKNFLLTNEKTYERKIKEAILAYRMTKSFSKDQILELYLNQIYLGSGAYGVAVAAETYFDKSIDELTIEEDALLATLPKAPSKLDPRKNLAKAKIRRDWVISRMLDEGFITSEEAKIATDTPIVLKEENPENISKADFFSDSVKKELTDLYGSDNVFEDGIVVRTTLDAKLQKIASKALENGIEEYDQKHGYRGALKKIDTSVNWQNELQSFDIDQLYKPSWKKAVVLSLSNDSASIGVENGNLGSIKLSSLSWARKYIDIDNVGNAIKKVSDVFSVGDVILVEKNIEQDTYSLRQIPEVNGAFIAIDPHTGRVLAMLGGYIDAPNQFNRATQAMRQPGSTLKTFGYIAALENGMTPATVIMDEEVTLNQGGDLPPYKPSNYSNHYYGPTTLRTGLEKSINVTTVRMADQAGLDNVVDVVKRFGVNDNPQRIYSLVLGSTETSLIRLVTAYAMMVNGGNRINPSMIEKIQDRNGATIYRRDKRSCEDCLVKGPNKEDITIPVLSDYRERITDSATAYQITSMLQGVVERGTSVRAKAIGKIVAGKTGTTNNSYDSWFVGFSPDLVAGAYIGFDLPRTLGAKETGSSVALPIFVEFMKGALKDTPSTPFRVPSSVKFVKIDRSTGKTPTASTPKDEIFFEAFKITDSLDENNSSDEEEVDNEFDNDSADPVGIY